MYFRVNYGTYLRKGSVVALVRDTGDPKSSTRIYKKEGGSVLVKMRVATLCRRWNRGGSI